MQELYHLWLRQIAAGDKQAFKLLFDEFYVPLLSVAEKFVVHEIAEDLVQEVFLKLWNNPIKFDEVISLKSFLYVSVKNLCFNHLRDSRSHRKALCDWGVQDAILYEAVMDEEVFAELRKAIDSLPDQYRQIMEMTLEGMKASEVADQLNMTEEAVKAVKKRSRVILRKKLGDSSYLFFFL